MVSESSSPSDELSEILEAYCSQKDHATVMAWRSYRQMRVATRAAEAGSVRDTKAPLRANAPAGPHCESRPDPSSLLHRTVV